MGNFRGDGQDKIKIQRKYPTCSNRSNQVVALQPRSPPGPRPGGVSVSSRSQGGWRTESHEMVCYANRSRTMIRVPNGSTPCATHHFPWFASHTLRLAAVTSSWQGYHQGRARACWSRTASGEAVSFPRPAGRPASAARPGLLEVVFAHVPYRAGQEPAHASTDSSRQAYDQGPRPDRSWPPKNRKSASGRDKLGLWRSREFWMIQRCPAKAAARKGTGPWQEIARARDERQKRQVENLSSPEIARGRGERQR